MMLHRHSISADNLTRREDLLPYTGEGEDFPIEEMTPETIESDEQQPRQRPRRPKRKSPAEGE